MAILSGQSRFQILLQRQLRNYLNVPIKQKILPLLGFAFYLTVIPRVLFSIIPQNRYECQYCKPETINLIIYITCLYMANSLTILPHAIFMYLVYTRKIPFLQKYRVSPVRIFYIQEKPWHWEQDANKWRDMFNRTLKTLLINTTLYGNLSLIAWALIFPRKVIINSQQMPTYWTIFWQIILFMIIEDLTSTFTHSMLHSPSLYWIHKKHHEYTTSVSISAEYSHPIEFIFSNSLPTIIGFIFLAYFYPVHIVSALTWLIFRILLTSDLHSGYEFPWDFYKLLPFTAPSSYHDFHHSYNVGNYASSFMFIQGFFGTNSEYYKYMKERNKKQALQRNKLMCKIVDKTNW